MCSDIEKESNVAYLLGSGLSIPFGLGNVLELTNGILEADKTYGLHTDQCYHFGAQELPLPSSVKAIIAGDFFRLIIEIIRRPTCVNSIDQPNYEDIADFIKQYKHSTAYEYENPALSSSYRDEIECYAMLNNVDVYDLLDKSMAFLNYFMKDNLLHNPQKVRDYIGILDNVFPEVLRESKLDIFTLNHDLIIENYMDIRNIKYNDGFSKDAGGNDVFYPCCLYENKEKIKFIKLHGSINW